MTNVYRNVMVAVDNSECSNYAINLGVDLASTTEAMLVGVHVYAARLHDTRFRQLEPGLPDRYQSEEVLQRQRNIHDDLIGRGLRIISDSYLDVFDEKCRKKRLAAARKAPEGRNYEQLVKEAREGSYDLVVIGAHGLGRVDRSILGSVCERVARLVDCDVLVVRNDLTLGEGKLLVAIDGSDHSFAALRLALALSKAYGNQVAAVAAYDPFFHSVAFKSIADVLSEEDSRLFRFREQERLHEEVIDKGLKGVYHSHLLEAQEMASREGISLDVEVLEGKPFDAVASRAGELGPAALVIGRVGIHHGEGVTLGSTAENLVRFAPCNVLVVNQDVERARAERTNAEALSSTSRLRWSDEAEQQLERVPLFARSIARKGIEDFARENGYEEVTLPVYEQARRRFGM